MNLKTKEQIAEIIKSIVGININSFDSSKEINKISEWDSFNNLMLISEFQEKLNVEFSTIEIEEIITIKDLLNLLEKKTSSQKK